MIQEGGKRLRFRLPPSCFIEYISILLEQWAWINASVNKLLELGNDSRTVGCVCYAKPAAWSVEHLACSLASLDELIDHERDEELALELLAVLGEETLEVFL